VSRGAGGTIFQPLALQPCARGGACWSMVTGWLAACTKRTESVASTTPSAPEADVQNRTSSVRRTSLSAGDDGQEDNAIPISTWIDDPRDDALATLLPLLQVVLLQRLLMLRVWSCYALLLAKGPVLHHIRRANVCTQLCHTVGARWCQRRVPPEACLFMSSRRLCYNT